ncbi:hypothetical protein JSO55_02745, partial [Riemerella anatipestifer]|uniref:hypothetical protein n=1 Tax=Riemerella anatipestifer TaxID=34085 RepID=UPI0030C45A4A
PACNTGFAKKRERFLFGHNVIFITFVLLGEVGGFLSASSQSPTIRRYATITALEKQELKN